MRSECDRVRARLSRGSSLGHEPHVEDCRECAEFVARLDAARKQLRDHHAGVEPDAAFVARVSARLHRDPARDLGWAATRLLPATLALLAVLLWIAVRTGPVVTETAEDREPQDLLTLLVSDGSEYAP